MAVVIEGRMKAIMEKHLEQILGQTEKYSKMLASNLTRPGEGEKVKETGVRPNWYGWGREKIERNRGCVQIGPPG
jgi:hypothetical protein